MKQNRLRTHFIYWILPTVVTLLCILIYFYDFFSASEIISPSFNREFGILENLQHLVILIIAIIGARSARSKKNKIEKYIFFFIAAASVFFFLEEIDYGLHYYDVITGREGDEKAYIFYTSEKMRNIHNTGKNTSILKMTSYVIIVVFFVLLPILQTFKKSNSTILQYITPSLYIIYTAVSLFLLNQFAFYLYGLNFHTNRSLDSTVSEFEELMFYYIILLYIAELARNRKTLPAVHKSYKLKQHST